MIKAELPPSYPDSMPDVYVVSPSPLLDRRGRPLQRYGTSHRMHLWETDRPGWTKLCVVHPDKWSAEYSVVKVLRKALLWTTAYEAHLNTGEPIDNFLL